MIAVTDEAQQQGEAERRRREVRKVMRDGETRTFNEMWIALDEQTRKSWRRPVDELVKLKHLVKTRQPASSWEGESEPPPPVYAITETGRNFDG